VKQEEDEDEDEDERRTTTDFPRGNFALAKVVDFGGERK
jgi:hypothetical protein